MDNRRLTIEQAAQQLEITVALCRKLVESGQLGKAFKNGKKTVYLVYQTQVDRIKG